MQQLDSAKKPIVKWINSQNSFIQSPQKAPHYSKWSAFELSAFLFVLVGVSVIILNCGSNTEMICFAFSKTGCIWKCRFGKKGLKSNKVFVEHDYFGIFLWRASLLASSCDHAVMDVALCCSMFTSTTWVFSTFPSSHFSSPLVWLTYSAKGPDITSLHCLLLPPALHLKFCTGSERLEMGPGNNSAR